MNVKRRSTPWGKTTFEHRTYRTSAIISSSLHYFLFQNCGSLPVPRPLCAAISHPASLRWGPNRNGTRLAPFRTEVNRCSWRGEERAPCWLARIQAFEFVLTVRMSLIAGMRTTLTTDGLRAHLAIRHCPASTLAGQRQTTALGGERDPRRRARIRAFEFFWELVWV